MSYDAADQKNQNVIERGFVRLKRGQSLTARYDKVSIVYRAAVVLNAVIAWLCKLQDAPHAPRE